MARLPVWLADGSSVWPRLKNFLRYIDCMFEVLVYVYENYWQGAACPEFDRLGRKLTAAGFEAEEIQAALIWLDGLNIAAQGMQGGMLLSPPADALAVDTAAAANLVTPSGASVHMQAQSGSSMRVYSVAEQERLGAQCLGFVCFLEASGVLPPYMREIVIDRALAVPGDAVALDDLKIIVLMVYWSFGEEPDALVLDELCDDSEGRLPH